jgi:tetratricopeptide (TPR) repeat protein
MASGRTGRALCVGALIGFAVACTPPKGADKKTALELAPPEITWQASSDPIERAPIALTTTDGAGLALVSLQVRTVIEEPLAFTELHMRFQNPEDRRREGRFEITLPQEAAISRFAMRIGSEMREGEVVERKRAQQVYEDFLHRRQDPALLEKDAGNEFAARVFPIEAHEIKDLVLSYSEEISSRSEPYLVRLAGLPELESFNVDIRVGSSSATGDESSDRARNPKPHTLTLAKTGFAPTGDLEVQLPRQKPMALRNGELVVARVVPVLSLPAAKVDGLTVLFDTSASRALGFGAQIERLGALVKDLQSRAGNDFELRVVAFDQTSEEIYRGPAGAFGIREQSKLLARGALGASSLEQVLAFIANGSVKPHARLLVVSDGVVTAGASDTTALREAIAKLAAHGAARLDVLGEGGIQDRDTLRALTRSGLREAGTVLDSREPVARLAERMLLGVKDEIEVNIGGASWVHPRVLRNVQAGDERLVFAELPAGVPVQIELNGAGAEAFDTLETPRPLLERAWVRAKIAALTEELNALRPDASEERAQREREVVALSTKHRVLSDFTALLVLESEHDYTRYSIPRDALGEILAIGEEGIELHKRDSRTLQLAKSRDDRPIDGEQQIAAPEPEPPTAVAPAAESKVPGRARGMAEGAPIPESARKERSLGELDKREQPEEKSMAPAGAPRPRPAPSAPAKGSLEDVLAGAANKPSADVIAQSAGMGSGSKGLGSLGTRGGGSAADEGRVLERRPTTQAPAQLEPSARVHGGAVEGLPADEARAAARAVSGRAKQCYARSSAPAAVGSSEKLNFELSITDKGAVGDAYVTSGSLDDRTAQNCILAALRQLRFPKPSGARASIAVGIELSMVPKALEVASDSPIAALRPARPRAPRSVSIPVPALEDAYEGVLGEVLAAVGSNDVQRGLGIAEKAVTDNPGDVLALVALGEALEAQKSYERAARAYGSIIDLFPSRTDLRRMAGGRLERLPRESAWLASDSYARAVEQRPDHPSGHRMLAYSLAKQGSFERAFEAMERALERPYREDRFEGAARILREDLGLLGAAWLRVDTRPETQQRVEQALAAHGAVRETDPSLRFVLSWETDANDVDFHIYDGRGGHAFYQKPKLSSGGSLYADITSGYGPECFAISGAKRAFPYTLQAHYFARGPMGFGMGKLQVVQHDGKGELRFEEHPFVIMKDKAFVQLAKLPAAL